MASVVSLMLMASLAATVVPRDAWYVHQHGHDDHGHVHGWDGTRVAGSTSSVRDFLHGHDHDGGDDHDHDRGHRHDHAAAAHGHRHGPGTHEHDPERPSPPSHRDHDHDPEHGPSTAVASAADVDGDGFRSAASHGASHAHWQSPFQVATATALQAPIVLAVRWTADVARHAATPEERARDWRARAPPVSV